MNLKCVIPQDLSITASPEFVGLTLSGLTDRHVLFSDSGVLTGDSDFTFVESQTVATATNATPIVIGIVGHGRQNGDLVCISGAVGNTAANGEWVVANETDDTFELAGSVGNGAYTPDSATADTNVEVSGCASVQHLRIEGTFNTHIGVDSENSLYFQTLNGGTANIDLLSSLGTGQDTSFSVYGVHGGPDDIGGRAGWHKMQVGWKPGRYQMSTAGTVMPIEIFVGGKRHQFDLNIDGSINMDKGPVNVTGGVIYGINGTAASPTYSFGSHIGIGMYAATNELNFTVNNATQRRLSIQDDSIVLGTAAVEIPIYAQDGLINSPSYSFVSDPSLGFYYVGTGVIGCSENLFVGDALTVTGKTALKGGNIREIKEITGTYAVLVSDYAMLMNGNTGACTANLPTPNVDGGTIYRFKCIDDTNPCVVNGGAKFIDTPGTTTITLSKGESIDIQFNTGQGWFIF